jgi:hypothetical protein
MTPRFTVMKIRPVTDTIGHRNTGGPTDRNRFAGETLRVYLPPKSAGMSPCDSQWIWRVHEDDVMRITGSYPDARGTWVCEHQVEAD